MNNTDDLSFIYQNINSSLAKNHQYCNEKLKSKIFPKVFTRDLIHNNLIIHIYVTEHKYIYILTSPIEARDVADDLASDPDCVSTARDCLPSNIFPSANILR